MKAVVFALMALVSISAMADPEVFGRKTNQLGCHSLANIGYPELELCSTARNRWEHKGNQRYTNEVRLTMQVKYHGAPLRELRFRTGHVDRFKLKKGAIRTITQIIPGTCDGGKGWSFTTEYKRKDNNRLRIRQKAPFLSAC